MLANNEIGSLNPLQAIAELCAARGIIVHTDASQAVGKIPVDVSSLGVDLLTVAGHKLYAPKGIGALYIAPQLGPLLEPLMHGAGHERGRRAGTEATLLLAGLGAAAQAVVDHLEDRAAHMAATRDMLWTTLVTELEAVELVRNSPASGLPNTLSVSFPDVLASDLLEAVRDEVAASAGAACHAGEVTVSRVIAAIGVPDKWARGTLRLSTGLYLTEDEAAAAGRALAHGYRALQA